MWERVIFYIEMERNCKEFTVLPNPYSKLDLPYLAIIVTRLHLTKTDALHCTPVGKDGNY